MTNHCEHCGKPIPNDKRKRRFCPAPAGCRQAWHRENTVPGVVSAGPRQLKSGKWQITVIYPTLPPVKNGDRVLVEKADFTVPEPSSAVRDSDPVNDTDPTYTEPQRPAQ